MQPDRDCEAALARRFPKSLRGHVHPADIARRLWAELLEHRRENPSGPLGPNRFTIGLSSEDMEQTLPFLPELSAELQRWVGDIASAQGLRLLGPPQILFETDESLQPGQFKVESQTAEPSGQPSLPAGQQPGE